MSLNSFSNRHLGPREEEISQMLATIGVDTLDTLISKTIPASIRIVNTPEFGNEMDEIAYLHKISGIASRNKVYRSYIGMGYYSAHLPAVIRRNILENPSWYTSYTPYQAEISQGRLEALLNFQTVIVDLTGLPVANASLLDEATAAAEAMMMMYNLRSREGREKGKSRFFADSQIFPQTLAVLQTRAEALGIEVLVGDYTSAILSDDIFGAILQYPAADGKIRDYSKFAKQAAAKNILVAVAADLLSLCVLTPPGEWGADVVVGSSQRFGIPMGFGGPHAAFFATREEYKRFIPGRIIGVTIDKHGNRALRMALQTREQHIKREKATSNICTSQALLATMASMYAVYHGPEGLKEIALRVHTYAAALHEKVTVLGYHQENKDFFDTLRINLPTGVSAGEVVRLAEESEINVRVICDDCIGVSIDETTGLQELQKLVDVFSYAVKRSVNQMLPKEYKAFFNPLFLRQSAYLTHETFHRYRSETEMMRYIKRLERKDFSLTHSMIPLGSCTMKLNAATEMIPFLWPGFADIHPFAPIDQTEGYQLLFYELSRMLCSITGFAETSFQPNSGAAGEYTGLLVIKKFLQAMGEGHRNIVLIPASAHGTNPASAAMAGFEIVLVECDQRGNINLEDLKSKAEACRDRLAALMITYPSTHGVFEEGVKEVTDIIHKFGGQIYMDGANMNAQVGLTSPAKIGADLCHINLHKTFAIPHGGGGPGMGPIVVADHLVEFLPTHPEVATGGINGIGAIAAAPFGSASILTISHAYCCMLGVRGLRRSTEIAILNANYIAACLKDYFPPLYKGENGYVAHELIMDCRAFRQIAGISDIDIAKRLMDYGFHAPTLSFPVHGTIMVEPTESESLQELDRFCKAMVSIYYEIMDIAHNGNRENNLLINAPHTQLELATKEWLHPYSRLQAAFPVDWVEENKIWPAVGRINDAYGDRNLVCACR